MPKGVFITIEGGEGTGKSTQIRLLSQSLTAAGLDVITTREPGGTPQAERIRNFVIQRDAGDFDPLTEALLMFAARREHLVDKIWPSLARGQWVISDRFADSSRAMQGYGHGLPQEQIETLYTLVAGDFQPDLTFIFDIDPETGLSRSVKHMQSSAKGTEATEDRFERMGMDFHRRLRHGFLETAKAFPDRCVVIDAAQDVASIHRQLLDVIAARFGVTVKEAACG